MEKPKQYPEWSLPVGLLMLAILIPLMLAVTASCWGLVGCAWHFALNAWRPGY